MKSIVCEGGEPGRSAVWQGELTGCFYQKALHQVRLHKGKADSGFQSLGVRHQALTGAFEDQNAKTTIAHLPLVRLEQLLVPDISEDEQRHIAAHLKAQPAAVEEARQAALLQVATGVTITQVTTAKLFRLRDPATVADWLHRYKQDGPTGLLIKEGRGRIMPAFFPVTRNRRRGA